MSRKLKWVRLVIIVMPILVFLCGTNYYVDPANIFHDSSKEMAEALLNGNEVYFGTGNGNERAVKYNTIRNLPKHLECITLGPSLALGIRQGDVGTNSYHNLSASGLNFNDIMGQIAMLEANNIKYDRMIYCVDSYFFDEELAKGFRNEEIRPYTEYMIACLDGKNPSIPKTTDDTQKLSTIIEQFFSVTYFQASMDFMENRDNLGNQGKRWGVVDEETEILAHYEVDGSWVYAASYQSNTVEDVFSYSKEYDIKEQFAYNRHLSEEYKVYFKKLIEHLLENDVTVEFYLCPLPPALWERLQEEPDHYFMIYEIEEYANEIAEEYGIQVIGSYNPYNVGITNDDFLDARHVRPEKLSEYFDFTE